MTRPTVEVADIIQAQGDRFVDSHRQQLSYQQLNVLRAIRRCRTAALGGHVDDCPRCGHTAISYNSCRNRHCPKCQAQARQRWLAAREQELLGVSYFHVVFTLPHELIPLCQRNPKILYDLLFQTSAATMLEVAADPKHLGAKIGFLSILHTWGQNLLRASSRPLRDSGRWIFRGPYALGASEVSVLPARESAQPGVSRQVRGRSQAGATARRNFSSLPPTLRWNSRNSS